MLGRCIFCIHPDGSDLRLLRLLKESPSFYYYDLYFLPDGQWFLFVEDQNSL